MSSITKDLIKILLLLNLSSIVQSFLVSRSSQQQQQQQYANTLERPNPRLGHPQRPRTTARTRPSVASVQQIQQSSSSTALFSSTLQRVKRSLTSQERTHEELKLGIAGFYDRSSKLWEDVWGEHMHHVSSFPGEFFYSRLFLIVIRTTCSYLCCSYSVGILCTNRSDRSQTGASGFDGRGAKMGRHDKGRTGRRCGLWHWRVIAAYRTQVRCQSRGHHAESLPGGERE
jgi:hypothetical protein